MRISARIALVAAAGIVALTACSSSNADPSPSPKDDTAMFVDSLNLGTVSPEDAAMYVAVGKQACTLLDDDESPAQVAAAITTAKINSALATKIVDSAGMFLCKPVPSS